MKTFVYNGKHLMVDVLTKGTYNLNDPSRISSCLESIVDSLDMTMILPPIIVKFPHSTSELKRTLKSLDKEAEKLRDQKKKLQAKIRPLVQDFNAKKIDRAKYDKKIGDIPKQIKDINKRLGEIEEEKDDILLKEKEDRRAVASTAMDRDVHRKLLEIIKEKGISLREGSENIRVYYEIAKLAYMEGLTAGLNKD